MSDKGKNPEIEDAIVIEEVESAGPIKLRYLIDTVLDYYASSGEQALTEGDEWKKGTEHMPQGIEVPEELDKEVRKAFIHQIKKFQK
jgi:hypothetical protein